MRMTKKLNKELVYAVKGVLMKYCVGKANAKTVSQIATSIGEELEDTDTTGSFIRGVVKHILKTTTLPIGSHVTGYFIIASEEEYEMVQAELDKRIDGIYDRKAHIESNWSGTVKPLD